MNETTLSVLIHSSQSSEDRVLAARYAPVLRFDVREPFLPLAVGYTIFRECAPSPSFRQGFTVDLAPPGLPAAVLAVEYAIWWDWDIGHLYELEHVWVYVDDTGMVVRVEASWHGASNVLWTDDPKSCPEGQVKIEDTHPVIFSEPGKHAFAPTPAWFKKRTQEFKRSETSTLAGASGILRAPYIRDQVSVTPLKTRLVHTYLAQHAFTPSWDFSQRCPITEAMLVPWPALCDWMPVRINAVLDHLAREIPPGDYRFLRIGHRGAASHAPHNTLFGLRKAAELGADVVECDVRRTGDGHFVLAHDPCITGKDGSVWPIRHSSLADLQAVDTGAGEPIATLDEAVDVCREEQLGTYLELKSGGLLPGVITLLKDKKHQAHSILAAFRPDWLAEVRALAPGMMTAVMFDSPHVDAVRLAQAVQATFVHPCWEHLPHPSALLTPAWIARVRDAGLGIITWHEERPEEIAALRALGVDGICSDRPELLK